MATSDYEQMSLAELGRRLIDTTSELVERQVALAKQELREDLRSALRGGVLIGAGGVLLLFAVVCLLIALVSGTQQLLAWALWSGWALWLAGLLWFLIFAALGAGCLLLGRQRIPIPPLRQTRTLVQEELDWAKQRLTPPAR